MTQQKQSEEALEEALKYERLSKQFKLPGDPGYVHSLREVNWWLNHAAELEARGL